MPSINTDAAVDVITNVNWLEPTWDLFIVLFFVVASLIYGVSLGRDRIIAILISIYMSLAIVNYLPFLSDFRANISINDAFALKVSLFLGVFILLFFFLSHSALIKTIGRETTQGKFVQVMFFSFLHVGLLISVTLSFFPADLANVLSPLTQQLFTSDIAKAVWVIIPVVAMAFFGKIDDDYHHRR
jgi:hypothetical protein